MPTAAAPRLWLTALLFVIFLPLNSWAQEFPPLTGRVVDAAGIIPADVDARLTSKLETLEKQSQRQLVVATVPSLQGYEISDYGFRLGRHWGIGAKDRNDGAVLIVAPNERKVRIEVGYGLEPILTDGLSFLIINNAILPRFKQDDYPGGIEAGTDAIISQLQLPEAEALKVAEQAAQAQQGEEAVDNGFAIFLMVMFFLFFVLPLFRSRRGSRRYRHGGLGPVIVWGGGSGWGGGGGFGGGGFSGGGGSFGGGGASGSW